MKDTVTFMNMNISKRLDTLLTEQQEKRNENHQRLKGNSHDKAIGFDCIIIRLLV